MAADQLNAAILRQYIRRAEACPAVRDEESVEWRTAAGLSDDMIYVTAGQLVTLTEQVPALPGQGRRAHRQLRGAAIGVHAALWIRAVGAVAGVLFVVFSPVPRMRELPDA